LISVFIFSVLIWFIMSDDGDIIPSVMQNGGSQYKIKEVSYCQIYYS